MAKTTFRNSEMAKTTFRNSEMQRRLLRTVKWQRRHLSLQITLLKRVPDFIPVYSCLPMISQSNDGQLNIPGMNNGTTTITAVIIPMDDNLHFS